MHTTPVVSLLIVLCMYPHQYLPKEAGYIMIVIFMAIYYSIIHMAHKYTGVWVYGLFDAISASQVRLLFKLRPANYSYQDALTRHRRVVHLLFKRFAYLARDKLEVCP